jgi:hypothetical protein
MSVHASDCSDDGLSEDGVQVDYEDFIEDDEEQVDDEQVAEEQVAEAQVVEEQVVEGQVAEEQVANEQASRDSIASPKHTRFVGDITEKVPTAGTESAENSDTSTRSSSPLVLKRRVKKSVKEQREEGSRKTRAGAESAPTSSLESLTSTLQDPFPSVATSCTAPLPTGKLSRKQVETIEARGDTVEHVPLTGPFVPDEEAVNLAAAREEQRKENAAAKEEKRVLRSTRSNGAPDTASSEKRSTRSSTVRNTNSSEKPKASRKSVKASSAVKASSEKKITPSKKMKSQAPRSEATPPRTAEDPKTKGAGHPEAPVSSSSSSTGSRAVVPISTSGPDLSFIPFPVSGAGPAAAAIARPMTQADLMWQGFESQLESARLSARNVRQDLKVETAAHAETKKVKDELKQVQDTRAEQALKREGALRGERSLLIKQVSDLEDELKAKSDALLKAKKQVREIGQARTTFQSLSIDMERERGTLKDENHDLGESIQELTDELEKANNKADKLLNDRTKANDALQVSRRKNKEHEAAAQSSIAALNLEAHLLQKSQSEGDQLNEQLQNRADNEQALHRRNVDLQRRHDDLNSDSRKARAECQRELDRQRKELEKEYKLKISKRDAIQQAERQEHAQELQRQLNSLQEVDNSPMVPATMMPASCASSFAGHRHTVRRDESHGRFYSQSWRGKGKGESKGKSALTGNKRGFSGGNSSSRSGKSVKIERSNDRRSTSKSRSPTRPPAGAGSSSISRAYFEDRAGAGDIVAPSVRLQNHAGSETGVNAHKHYLENQEQEVEFVFSDTGDDDGKGDVTDDGTGGTVTPPQPSPEDNQNRQDGPMAGLRMNNRGSVAALAPWGLL